MCQANVSDEIYSVKEGETYIHFECMTKELKRRMQEEFPDKRNFKVYYLGSGNFAAVNEKNSKGNIAWEIILKINTKELILEKLKKEETTD